MDGMDDKKNKNINIKKSYLFVVFALLFMLVVAISAKVVFLNVNACQASGKVIAETFGSSSPVAANSSFEPQIFIIAFLVMIGGALGMVLLNGWSERKNSARTSADEKSERKNSSANKDKGGDGI